MIEGLGRPEQGQRRAAAEIDRPSARRLPDDRPARLQRPHQRGVALLRVRHRRVEELASADLPDDVRQPAQMVLVPVGEKDEVERRMDARAQELRQRPSRAVGTAVDQHRLPGRRRHQRRVPLPHVDEVDPQRPGRQTGGERSSAAPTRAEASNSRRANELAFDNENDNGSNGSSGHDSLSSRRPGRCAHGRTSSDRRGAGYRRACGRMDAASSGSGRRTRGRGSGTRPGARQWSRRAPSRASGTVQVLSTSSTSGGRGRRDRRRGGCGRSRPSGRWTPRRTVDQHQAGADQRQRAHRPLLPGAASAVLGRGQHGRGRRRDEIGMMSAARSTTRPPRHENADSAPAVKRPRLAPSSAAVLQIAEIRPTVSVRAARAARDLGRADVGRGTG